MCAILPDRNTDCLYRESNNGTAGQEALFMLAPRSTIPHAFAYVDKVRTVGQGANAGA